MKHYLFRGRAHRSFRKARTGKSPHIVNSFSRVIGRAFPVIGSDYSAKGEVLIARAQSLEELKEFLADEPYCKAKVMQFSKIIPIQSGAAPAG